jgi:hypothetical protein
VYIKKDPTNTKAKAEAANRMPATGVTLRMALKYKDEIKETSVPVAFHPDDEKADWSKWSKISITTARSFSVSQFDSPEDTYIQVMITPTDATMAGNNKDAGSVLIAAPSLEYLPDGPD